MKGLECGADDFLYQADQRCGAGRAGEEPGAAQDGDRRAGAARRGAGIGRPEPVGGIRRQRRDRRAHPRRRRPRELHARRSVRRCRARSRWRSPAIRPRRSRRRGGRRLRPHHDQPVAQGRRRAAGSARSSRRSTGCGRRRSCSSPTPTQTQQVMRALDLGVNDYIIRPIDSERAARPRAHAASPQALSGAAAQHGLERRGARGHRSADRALQSALSRRASRLGRGARRCHRQAGLRAHLRHRPLQGDQRHLRPRRRRRRAEGASPSACGAACAASTSSRATAARSSCW